MGKIIILVYFLLLFKTADGQVNCDNMIFSAYEEEMTSFLNTKINISYLKRDTVIGFEIFYYMKNNEDYFCLSDVFFLPAVLYQDSSIQKLLTENILSSQLTSDSPSQFLIINPESINNLIQEKENAIYSNRKKISKVAFYKISDCEFINVCKSEIIVDVYSGGEVAFQLYNPYCKKRFDNIISYQIKKIIQRKYLRPKVLFGEKRIKIKKVNCVIY